MGFRSLLSLLLLLCLSFGGSARISPQKYGIEVWNDSARIAAGVGPAMDSFINAHPALKSGYIINRIEVPHEGVDRTAQFYLLLFLCLLLGAIRTADPRYFNTLLRAFRHGGKQRHLQDSIENSIVPNTLMNIFFAITAGAFLSCMLEQLEPGRRGAHSPGLFLVQLCLGVMGVYIVKYLAMRFSGWAFRVESITGEYLFNVFLVNKILGIALLPAVVLLTFSSPEWQEPILILSLIVTGGLILMRYLRSWPAFGSFFQYSRFHFLAYICASEILPLAVLLKLLLRGWTL
jgi:hypothetical protein